MWLVTCLTNTRGHFVCSSRAFCLIRCKFCRLKTYGGYMLHEMVYYVRVSYRLPSYLGPLFNQLIAFPLKFLAHVRKLLLLVNYLTFCILYNNS